jgi:ATP:corrinoid adenosyltransferase
LGEQRVQIEILLETIRESIQFLLSMLTTVDGLRRIETSPAQKGSATGRGGGSALQGVMDTVSEVKEIKHAFKEGIKARKGVDY